MWSSVARENLKTAAGRVSPARRAAFRRRFYRDARQLARFPESGRAVPEYELATIRELVQAPYRMFYEVQADRIEIIALVHGARDLSAG